MYDERTARASGDTEGEPGMETPADPPGHQRTAKAVTFTERPPPGHDVDDAPPSGARMRKVPRGRPDRRLLTRVPARFPTTEELRLQRDVRIWARTGSLIPAPRNLGAVNRPPMTPPYDSRMPSGERRHIRLRTHDVVK